MRLFEVHSQTTIHEVEGDEHMFNDKILMVYNNKKLVLLVNLEKIIAIEIKNI